jgi:hypothetical protein
MRTWRVHKEAGRPYPKVSDDDVIDYLVVEALALKAGKERQEAEEAAKKQDWKNQTEDLRKRAGA